ncbi:MAG: hypothetical protein LUD52_06040 [Opitutae bacterium]|nr:hypothetical protein [Opitutae bacterium]
MLKSEIENEVWKCESSETAGKIAYYNRAGEIVRVSRGAVERVMVGGNVLAFVTPANESAAGCVEIFVEKSGNEQENGWYVDSQICLALPKVERDFRDCCFVFCVLYRRHNTSRAYTFSFRFY